MKPFLSILLALFFFTAQILSMNIRHKHNSSNHQSGFQVFINKLQNESIDYINSFKFIDNDHVRSYIHLIVSAY